MVLDVKNLSVTYKDVIAVDDITFRVNEGEIFSIIGPNGAGKTSTIESILGLNKAYSGEICLLGKNPKSFKKSIYNEIGIQLQESSYPDKLKVGELCRLFSSFYSNPLDYKVLLNDFDVAGKEKAYVHQLSGGQVQKLSILLALLPDSKVIFLDELTTGLDPKSRHELWNIILMLKERGKTVILSTHFMDEAEYLSDRICILINGKIKLMGSFREILSELNLDSKITFSSRVLFPKNFSEANFVQQEGNRITILTHDGEKTIMAVKAYLQSKNIQYVDLYQGKPNLEDVFLLLTGTRSEDL
jgi:ABC-2 type transport system ATP-binding protein